MTRKLLFFVSVLLLSITTSGCALFGGNPTAVPAAAPARPITTTAAAPEPLAGPVTGGLPGTTGAR